MKLFQRLRTKERSNSPADADRSRRTSLPLLSIADEQTEQESKQDSPNTRKPSGSFSITAKSTSRDLDRKRSFPFLRPSFSKHATIVTTDVPAEVLRTDPPSPVRPRHAIALERPSDVREAEPLSEAASTPPPPVPVPAPRTTRWRDKVASRPTSKRPATADANAAGGGPPLPFGSTKIQRHLTATTQKAAEEMQELDRQLSKDIIRIAGHLGPPPAGFEEDAFDERIDLIKALVSCHASNGTASQENIPQRRASTNARATAAEILERIEVRVEKILRSKLAEGQTDRRTIESLRLPLAFATARQQCGLSAKTSNFKLFTQPESPKIGLGLGFGISSYPEIAPRRSSREFSAASPPVVRPGPLYVPATFGEALDALQPMHSLTPPPRRRRRPTTAPDSGGGPPPPFRSPSRQSRLSTRPDESPRQGSSRILSGSAGQSVDTLAGSGSVSGSTTRMMRSGSATIERPLGRIPFMPRHEAAPPRRERAASVGRAGALAGVPVPVSVPFKSQRPSVAMLEEQHSSPPGGSAPLIGSDGDGASSDFTLSDAQAERSLSLASASASSHRTLAVPPLEFVHPDADADADKPHVYAAVVPAVVPPTWAS